MPLVCCQGCNPNPIGGSMRKLKNLLSGLFLLWIVYFLDRSFDAPEMELEEHSGANPSSGSDTHEPLLGKENAMRKELPTWAWVVFFLIALIPIFAIFGCAGRVVREEPIPQPVIVVAPIVQNNLDFLYFAIAERGGLEAWFCMLGFYDPKSGALLIQGITPVWVDSASGSAIMGRPRNCPPNVTIGTVHFHPSVGYCALSPIDIVTAHNMPYPAVAIVCQEERGKPQFQIHLRKEIDEFWRNIPVDTNARPFTFTPIYRYKQ